MRIVWRGGLTAVGGFHNSRECDVEHRSVVLVGADGRFDQCHLGFVSDGDECVVLFGVDEHAAAIVFEAFASEN